MKKFITLFVTLSILATSLFATETSITIKGSVVERYLTTALSYNTNGSTWLDISDSSSNSPYEISASNELTESGETNDFRITYSSNKTNDVDLTVKIIPSAFYLESGSLANDATSLIPTVNTVSGINYNTVDGSSYTGTTTITAGNHTNDVASQFNLQWAGQADLASGDYVSNVSITYTAE